MPIPSVSVIRVANRAISANTTLKPPTMYAPPNAATGWPYCCAVMMPATSTPIMPITAAMGRRDFPFRNRSTTSATSDVAATTNVGHSAPRSAELTYGTDGIRGPHLSGGLAGYGAGIDAQENERENQRCDREPFKPR